MSYTSVFGGTTIYPSDVSYLPLALSVDTTLEWPLEASGDVTVAARIIGVTPASAGLSVIMPDATRTGTGQSILFNNMGPSHSFLVKDDAGNTLATVTSGTQWQIYLTDNTTAAGTWEVYQMGASTATVQASALAGPGLTVVGSQLAQAAQFTQFTGDTSVSVSNRALMYVYTGTGAATLSLPSAAEAGSAFFVRVRNQGGGVLLISPNGTNLVNDVPSLNLAPEDSAMLVSDGQSKWYTVGLGQNAEFIFDFVSIPVTGAPGVYTLSGAELNRIAYRFTGALITDTVIIVPETVQQYWVTNLTTGDFTLGLKTPGQVSPTLVNKNASAILYCDGQNVVLADTSTLSLPVEVAQGGTGADSPSGARSNLGISQYADPLVTAADASAAQSVLFPAPITDGQMLIGNAATPGFAQTTLTAGTGISVVNGPGTVTIVNTGSPAPGSVYSQRFSGTGSQVAFTLSYQPYTEENTQVYINGVYQQKDTYSLSGFTITFSAAPPLGTNNIEVVVIQVVPLGVTNANLVNYNPAFTGAVAETVQSKLEESVSVQDFGADPTGVTDSTTAFSAAIATVRDTMQPVPVTAGATTWALPQDAIFLPGGTYKLSDVLALIAKSGYGATELSIWAIPGTVSVSIPAGKYAFETSITLLSLYIYGINFFGGKGVFKDSFTGVNVKGFLRLRDCVFDNYTECAIQHNASDMPYWRIENCSFMGADGQPTIGIAINGLADSSIISGNTFLRNKWHIKYRNVNSGNVYIQNNDFINWGGTTVREADIWFTGSTTNLYGLNAGNGTLVIGNKFGNENSTSGKPRIMFAVEDTSVGTDNGSRNVNSTVWTTAAGGSPYVRSLQFKSNRISTINGAAGPGAPFMMSYLDKVSGILVDRDNAWDGGRWDYLVQFMDGGARVGSYDTNDWDVRLSAYSGITGLGSPVKEISNYPIGPVRLSSVPMLGTHVQPEYSTLLGNETTLANCATQADWQLSGGATKASATGPDGVSGNAALITCAATSTQAYKTVVNVTGYENRVCWVSMALSQAAANSVTEIKVQLFNFSTNQIAFQYQLKLPAQWGNVPFCFSFELPASASPASWQLRLSPVDYAAGTKTDFLVGQLHINTGAAPLRRPLANFIADPTGGATVDTQARTAINAILDALISGNIMKAV